MDAEENFNILIVEDSTEYATLLKKYLEDPRTVSQYLDEIIQSWQYDDIDTKLIKRHALEKFRTKKLDITTVTSPKDCISMVHTTPLDAIIIDYHLPHMNGLTLFQELDKEFSKLRKTNPDYADPWRILLSSNTDGKLVLDLAKDGVEYYIAKGDSEIHGLLSIMATGYYYESRD